MSTKVLRLPGILIVLMVATLQLVSCSRNPQKAKMRYFSAGQNYLKKGQFGDASIEFRNALRLDPSFVEAYYQLARADMEEHEWNGAYGALEKAIALDPGRLDARLDLARLYLSARQYDQTEQEASFVIKQSPGDVAAYQLLGAAFIGQRKPEQALGAFSKVIELLPSDGTAYLNVALVEIGLNRSSDAEAHLRKAIAVEPKVAQAYIDLADFYQLQNRFQDAEQVLRNGLERNPDGVPLYVSLAGMLENHGRGSEAEALIGSLRSQLPKSVEAAIAIGDFYFQSKRADQALEEYRRGLTVSPRNLDVQRRIQDIYLSANQIQSAVALDQQLLKQAPKDAIVQVDHGRVLMAQGKTIEAITALQKVARDVADSTQAHYFLGMAFWQNGEFGQANSALLDALRVSPDLPVVLSALVRLNLIEGNNTVAENYARDLVQKSPADPADRELLGQALAGQGHFKEAETEMLTADQLAPQDAFIHLSLAQIYKGEQKWADAEKEFDAAFSLNSRSEAILEQWTTFHVERNQAASAMARVSEYVRANPAEAKGHVLLANLDQELNDYAAARGELERALQVDPQFADAYVQLGRLSDKANQPGIAIKYYEKASQLNPNSAPLATMLANHYLDQHDLQSARRYYLKALSVDPNFAIANANLAWVDAEENRELDVALGMAQKAKSMMPDLPSITDTLAWVMYRRGDYTAAVPLLRDCVQKAPDSATFHYHLGMTLLAIGQKAQAKNQLESALHLNLVNTYAEMARRELTTLN